MHKSIRSRLTVILILTIGCIIGFTWLVFRTAGERYYISTEQNRLELLFQRTKRILKKDDNSAIWDELEDITTSGNIKMMIAQSGGAMMNPVVLFSNVTYGSRRYEQVLGYLNVVREWIAIDGPEEFDKINLEMLLDPDTTTDQLDLSMLSSKGYFLTQINDKDSGQKALYLFGFGDKGYLIGMQASIEGIRESAKVGSRFLLIIGIIGIVLGSFAMFYLSGRFTKPIKEMADVADRMAALDFDARIETDGENELAALGHSMNAMSKELEKTIGDLKAANLQLQKDIAKKEQIDEMRREFLSHVSHELKTPIALIQGYAEGLRENINDDPESRDFYCEVIMDEAAKMNTMVKRMLALDQIESGDQTLEMTRFDMTALIRNKIAASMILLDKKKVEIIFEETNPVNVWADEYLIEEVFSNYLSNAIHYVTQGGTIRISYERMEKDLRVHVYNDGDPIPDKEINKLWIKFYKIDKARTREYGGNGIGLSIVAAVMNAHGKAYGVFNTEKGVDFYFDLDRINA